MALAVCYTGLSMYFANRVEAGQKLAINLSKYRYENCAVVALSDGGVVVAAQIAQALHCVLTLLLTESIKVPGEPEAVGVINQDGGFTYNNMYSAGQLEELTTEFHQYIDQDRLQKFHDMNRLLGQGGLIRRDLLYGHNVILVSDGLNNAFSLDAAVEFLKPVKTQKLIVATPLASVPAVDRMHVLVDEIHCLSVIDNYVDTNHYYQDNSVPNHETLVKTIQQVVLSWK